MRALQTLVAVSLFCLLLVGLLRAADDAPALQTAQGVVEKVEKDTLTVKPRAKDGRFERPLVLKLTGTSKVSTLSTQTRGNNLIRWLRQDVLAVHGPDYASRCALSHWIVAELQLR